MKTRTTPSTDSNFLIFATAIKVIFSNTDCVVETTVQGDVYGNGNVVKTMYVFTPYGHFRINECGKTQVELATIASYGIVKGFGTKVMSILSAVQDNMAKNGRPLTLRLSATPDFDFNMDFSPMSVKSKSWSVNLPKGKQAPQTPINKLMSFYSKFGYKNSGKLTRTNSGLPSQDMVRTPKPQQIFTDADFDSFTQFFS